MIWPMSRLCLSCGLCCNGVIFSSVPVASHDDVARLEGSGITVERIDGEHRFAQPCAAHDGRTCRVYADRPTACRQYRCDLLQRVEEGGIELAEARRLIGETVRLNRELAQAIREVEPRDDGHQSRVSLLKKFSVRLEESLEAETQRKVGTVVVHLLALDEFIRRTFGSSVLEWKL
jgi:Fe-S-cluster containining protein